MLFTWDTTNLCIIFRWWHITSTFTLLISLIAVALLTSGYELVREVSRRYEMSSAEYVNSLPSECYFSIFGCARRTRAKPIKPRMMVMNEAHYSGQGRIKRSKRRRPGL